MYLSGYICETTHIIEFAVQPILSNIKYIYIYIYIKKTSLNICLEIKLNICLEIRLHRRYNCFFNLKSHVAS